jgi:hypothetical protein
MGCSGSTSSVPLPHLGLMLKGPSFLSESSQSFSALQKEGQVEGLVSDNPQLQYPSPSLSTHLIAPVKPEGRPVLAGMTGPTKAIDCMAAGWAIIFAYPSPPS